MLAETVGRGRMLGILRKQGSLQSEHKEASMPPPPEAELHNKQKEEFAPQKDRWESRSFTCTSGRTGNRTIQ